MIDPRAIVDPGARLDADVSVGPFSIIGADVEIGAGTVIGPHVVIEGPTRIGRDNRFAPHSSIGGAPQDKKYGGEPTRLEIGDRNLIREYCTFNRGTVQGGGVTRLGNDNWIMAYVHLAHDCQVGNHTIFANGSTLAGHVEVEDKVILGAFTVVHQFCRIGAHAFSGMGTVIKGDVPPFTMINGSPAAPHGINAEGLKRNGYSAEQINQVRRAHKVLYKSGLLLEEALEKIRWMAEEAPELGVLAEFFKHSRRPLIR